MYHFKSWKINREPARNREIYDSYHPDAKQTIEKKPPDFLFERFKNFLF